MRDILPGSQSHEHERFIQEQTTWKEASRVEEWKRDRKERFPQIRIGHCFSQRRPLKQTMIDLDSTSVNIQRHPPTISKELYGQRVGDANESPPPRVIVFRNDHDMSDFSAEEQYSKSSHSSVDDGYAIHRTADRPEDDICNDDQLIVKVDPKTPPMMPTPESEPEKAVMWDETGPPSPNSVIIKVEPRTPSPIVEEEPESEAERDSKPPEFLSGMYFRN